MLHSPEGPCGFVVDDDAQCITDAIAYAAANPEIARSRAAAAARKAARDFSVPAMVRAYELMYEEVLRNERSAATARAGTR
jgi:glycosyltransferase involved in cell wall biosynthesis